MLLRRHKTHMNHIWEIFIQLAQIGAARGTALCPAPSAALRSKRSTSSSSGNHTILSLLSTILTSLINLLRRGRCAAQSHAAKVAADAVLVGGLRAARRHHQQLNSNRPHRLSSHTRWRSSVTHSSSVVRSFILCCSVT